jgi:hypothetical protein
MKLVRSVEYFMTLWTGDRPIARHIGSKGEALSVTAVF